VRLHELGHIPPEKIVLLGVGLGELRVDEPAPVVAEVKLLVLGCVVRVGYRLLDAGSGRVDG
jgi:hypothetical protein